MPVTYDGLMSLKSEGDVFTYGDRETMLYALGVGMGRDPMNEAELPFVYENGLRTVPTLASVIAWGQRTIGQAGINYLMVVHGEQRLTVHKPLPASATIIADERVIAAVDKGAGKGALIYTEKVIRLKDTNEKLCTIGGTIFARGDGGFGGPSTGGLAVGWPAAQTGRFVPTANAQIRSHATCACKWIVSPLAFAWPWPRTTMSTS